MSVRTKRPLSPHLQIYRPQITSVLSIFHRITGVILAVGSLFFVAWLWAAAYDSAYFAMWRSFFGSIFGQLMLVGWSAAFYYHFANGIRHLAWDIGLGFGLNNVTRTGIASLLFTAAATLLTWIIIWSR